MAAASRSDSAYGTEAMRVLSPEKGDPIISSSSTKQSRRSTSGSARVVSKRKISIIGSDRWTRSDAARQDRRQLDARRSRTTGPSSCGGRRLVLDPSAPIPMPMIHHVTSGSRSTGAGPDSCLRHGRGGQVADRRAGCSRRSRIDDHGHDPRIGDSSTPRTAVATGSPRR